MPGNDYSSFYTSSLRRFHAVCVCVSVNLASTMLGLCYDRVFTHRPMIQALLGAADYMD